MFIFRWFFRLIWAAIFGAVCGLGGFAFGAIVFGIIEIFFGWNQESTKTAIWICTGIAALWGVIAIIRNGIEGDKSRKTVNSFKKEYEKATGEKYEYIPSLDSIGTKSTQPKTNQGYMHTDLYGKVTGFSKTSGNSTEHYSPNGYGVSHRSGNDVTH